jgi:hypothetical protein
LNLKEAITTMDLFSDGTWLLLDHYGILVGDILMTLTTLAGIYGFFKRNDLRRWLTRNRFPSIGGKPDDMDWQGLIFTVSRSDVPLWVIGQVRPRLVGLLHSAQTQEAAKEIERQVRQQGCDVLLQALANPDAPEESLRHVQALIRRMREAGTQKIAVDVTGGKVPMSLGAFMAAEEAKVDTVYVTTDSKNGKPDMTTAKIIAVSQPGTQS